MELLIKLLISGLAVFITAYLLPGVHVDGFFTALVVAVILGVINAIIKPIILILTLPINIITLGLFTFVVNACMILITSALVTGFDVANFWWALLFSLVLSIVGWFLQSLT